jgi:hypothetical protein
VEFAMAELCEDEEDFEGKSVVEDPAMSVAEVTGFVEVESVLG